MEKIQGDTAAEGRRHSMERQNEFLCRHLGPSPSAIQQMLATLEVGSVDELISEVIPDSIRQPAAPDTSAHQTEAAALARLQAIASKNRVFRSFIGAGYYNCHTPSVILRNVLQNPAWYTSYTPYQPEISQGRLESLLNFQTMVSDLTGLEIANASLLDEATAAAEAMAMAFRISNSDNRKFFVSKDTHQQTITVLQTRARPLGIDLLIGDPQADLAGLECFAAFLSYPSTTGEVSDFSEAIRHVHESSGLIIMAADLLSLTLLKSPGEWGADIAVGSTQRFGIPLFFGGPHAAYLATSADHRRALPGRLIGVSQDAHGNSALRMALQTREQHIRRDRATSNICTSQALLAMMAGFYAMYHGPEGLRRIASRVHRQTTELAIGLRRLGYTLVNENWFDTLTVETGDHTANLHASALERQINLRHFDEQHIGISLDETTRECDVLDLLACFADSTKALSHEAQSHEDQEVLDGSLLRTSEYLTHPVFHLYRSETEMMRYLRSLADKDLALDRTMIPLGSCTMKLNAATEMMAVTWPEFSDIHPLAPADQVAGYRELIDELEQMLCRATGYDAVSLQPNAGSQGEFAGLLAIRAYHASRGESNRDICLIPESAHGTNPASAKLAGMEIVAVSCDDQGNIDLQDLRQKAEQHSDRLAAIMITYPSTHGVFETAVSDLCELIHRHGGQVYIDGANLNAQLGWCQPRSYGGDVSHLNLHKTFCIPHGGGGPGVGPVAVREHLRPFLPGDPQQIGRSTDATHSVGAVSAARWGSAGILPISWAYIYMMGGEGMRQASAMAILNANYVATRLEPHYPVLYSGAQGRVAHECILDVRSLKDSTGIKVDDIAKRLVDYGFHAPTMSFPVPGTLMIEPTESESKAELDRFCEAMIKIREEIQAVEDGHWNRTDNPLKNAPHTALSIASDDWDHSYSRQIAAYPVPSLQNNKYWPPVGRVDHAYGDRNLQCTCPSARELEMPTDRPIKAERTPVG